MKRKLLKTIFIILYVYPIITLNCSSHNGNEESCINTKDVGKYPDYCCYFDPIIGQKENVTGECKQIPYSSHPKNESKEYIDGILYNVTCNVEEEAYPLEECGNIYQKDKASLKNCKKFSTFVDSCCYYKGYNDKGEPEIETNFVKGCYWLGSKYDGKIFWAGIRLECNQNYLNYYLFYIFTFIFGILLL